MPEICNITVNANDEKMISLQPELIKSIEGNLLIKANQHSAPFCIHHFKADQHKGWAEIEIDPLPNVFMTIGEVQAIIHPLLKTHRGDIPIASLLYCIESELNIKVQVNERGVSLEHLVCCVPNVQTKNNDFGIKVVAWSEAQTANGKFYYFVIMFMLYYLIYLFLNRYFNWFIFKIFIQKLFKLFTW